jgi:hypothetical protein
VTQDDLIRMAREASEFNSDSLRMIQALEIYKEWEPFLERFAALVAEATKEKAAKLVEPTEEHRREARYYLGGEEGVELLDGIAAAIRSMK